MYETLTATVFKSINFSTIGNYAKRINELNVTTKK